MNLETKITIYKFTPQLFTLTRYIKVIKWSLVYYHLTTFFDLFYDAWFGDYVHNESLVVFIPSNIRLNSKFT